MAITEPITIPDSKYALERARRSLAGSKKIAEQPTAVYLRKHTATAFLTSSILVIVATLYSMSGAVHTNHGLVVIGVLTLAALISLFLLGHRYVGKMDAAQQVVFDQQRVDALVSQERGR